MSDTLLDLADALVTALGTLATSLGTTTGEGDDAVRTPAFTASWQADPVADLADSSLLSPAVWVTDFAEGDVSLDGSRTGVPIEESEILVILQRKIGKGEDAATICRNMSALASEIRMFCRKSILDSAVCFKTERTRARDFKEWHESDLYRAEISTHWRRVCEEMD
jgi:hypothetical protein